MPIGVAQHEIRRAVGTVLIGAVEETSKMRLESQHVEVVPGRAKARGEGWILARVQPDERELKGGQAVESAVAVA